MRRFLGELRRRGVLGALAAYAVAAAGVLQLADIVVHNLDLPAWTVRGLIWVAVLGFAATFVVSWFYDLTRRGFVRTQAPGARAATPATPRPPTVPTPQPPALPEELEPGALLAGRYRLERELGKGGMGRVLVARDEKLDRRVAVKVVTGAHDPVRVRRFEQEARTAGSLEHPNVLAVYDLGEHGGVPFLVTELLAGHTLRTVIDGPPLPPAQVQGLFLQLAQGLAAAHGRGIVHRDLKPENLFLTDDGRLKILDFGLARLTGDEQGPGLTLTGAVFGSPGYLSPEQARGEKAGPPSDIFSAGAVIYEMLTGKRAFPGASLIEAGHAALTLQPARLPPSVPFPLASVVLRSLEKDPARRYRNGGELVQALSVLEPAAPVTLPPRPKSWRRSTSLMVALAMLAIGAALASGARVLRSTRGQARAREPRQVQVPPIPVPPVPPPEPGVVPGIPGPDAKKLARDIEAQVRSSVPRAGTLGLIVGARALERTNRADRAEEILRRSRDPIARLELFLLQRKRGQGTQAVNELRAFARSMPDGDWPAPLVHAYLGEAKDAQVIAAAEDSDDRCDAWYYLGRLHAAQDRALAEKQLQKASAEDCDQSEFAGEELRALQSR
ncbi:MAG TPA: serine/threonine-protein kinase [Myxococcales bacterium]|nr:serine/threonine-protein kinase [Myxococcales bacterium]